MNKFGISNIPSVFISLSKKRNQSKKSLTEMINLILNQVYPKCSNQVEQEAILRSIIEITEGKIYVEFEYSVAIRKLSEILILKGQKEEATKLIQDIQIETFGSLDKKYKVEYILFQIKVLLEKGDFVRTLIVSNKIVRKHLEEKGMESLKIMFYLLMIKYYIHEENFYDASKCYQVLYDFYVTLAASKEKVDPTNSELINLLQQINAQDLLEKFIYFLNISSPVEEVQKKILEVKTKYAKELEEFPVLGKLIDIKTSDEIVQVTNNFLSQFNSVAFIDNPDFFINGINNARLFRKYIIQHNLQIFHKFYSQIFLNRIAEIISIHVDEVESEICDMVMSKFFYAKINRIKGTVSFRPRQTFERKSDALNDDLSKMLETLEMTCHLIHKENLKYGIKLN